jgi:type VI secretion system protein ImpA
MGIDAPSFAIMDSQFENIHSTLKKVYKTDAFGATPNSCSARYRSSITIPAQNNAFMPIPESKGFRLNHKSLGKP